MEVSPTKQVTENQRRTRKGSGLKNEKKAVSSPTSHHPRRPHLHLLTCGSSVKQQVLSPQQTPIHVHLEKVATKKKNSLAYHLQHIMYTASDFIDYKAVHMSPARSLKENLSTQWHEIQGSNNWENLLDPLHPWLRREIIKYGEFAQATYDAFDFDPLSEFCGSCRYNKNKLFDELKLTKHGYKVTKYIYAMSHVDVPSWLERSANMDDKYSTWSKDSNWIGYVAVSNDVESQRIGRRDIVVAWRGTIAPTEWFADIKTKLEPIKRASSEYKVSATAGSIKRAGSVHETPATAGSIKRASSVHKASATVGSIKRASSVHETPATVGSIKMASSVHETPASANSAEGRSTFDNEKDVKVERGFQSIYKSKSKSTRYNKLSASEQVMKEINRLVNLYDQTDQEVSLTITGHSLGGALALLNAYEAATLHPDLPVSVISFAAPRVGNIGFKNRMDELGVKVLRVVVKQDVVPKLPGIIYNKLMNTLHFMTKKVKWVYRHVGVELKLDTTMSPYLKQEFDLLWFHNLEAYLHLVDAFVGANSKYRWNARRDVALVNKSSDMLIEELRIPENWYQLSNKGLVFNSFSGRWVKPGRVPEDQPSPSSSCGTPPE